MADDDDPYFGPAYVDLDERREAPHPHRYVHGGFEGTDARFAFYFPDAAGYGSRLLTVVEGGAGGHEGRAARMGGDGPGTIGFAFSCGAFLVESNGGHIAPGAMARTRGTADGSITTYRATAQATRFARRFAETVYGAPPRHGYIMGGSGGGWRTIIALENAPGLWDGAVPYISPAGHGISFPSLVGNLLRVLGDDVSRVAAAYEPGGGGDPFAGLTTVQRRELATAYRAGFQPGTEFQLEHPGLELDVLLTTSGMHAQIDPAYFSDFWTLPGHAGADGELDHDVLDERFAIRALVTVGELLERDPAGIARVLRDPLALARDTPVALLVEGGAPAGARGARATIGTREYRCFGVAGGAIVLDVSGGPLEGAAGDEVALDNRDYLAYCHAYRHQVDRGAIECRQLLSDGVAIYPQRELSVSDVLAGETARGSFEGRMIYVSNVHDTCASPLGGTVGYLSKVRAALAGEDRLRVWLTEHAGHIQASERPQGPPPVASTRLIDWAGAVEQALLDLIAWVEEGVAPPPDSAFEVDDGRIRLASGAEARRGIQPLVSATAAAQARVGEPVRLTARAEAPPGTGTLVAVEWDFDGRGTWPYRHAEVDGSSPAVEVAVEHAFDAPGTYFPAVRVTAHRDGDPSARHGRVRNLARVRVDVA